MDEFERMYEQAREQDAQAASRPENRVDGTYSGLGVGRKERVGENSYRFRSPNTEPSPTYVRPQWTPPQPPQPETAPQQAKKKKGRGKAILAASLIAAIIGGLGGGALAGYYVNNRWEQRTETLTSRYEAQLEDAVERMEAAVEQASSPTVPVTQVTISPSTGMTPSQVYQDNVDAVVYIENHGVTVTNYYGHEQESEFVGSGSGFVISGDGYILTNYHVVADYKTLTVTMPSGEKYGATLVGYDSYNDVALLKVEANGLPCVAIGDSDAANVGDQVVAIGNPLGELTSTLTAGYVSAKDRQVNTDGTIINMIQTDAAINSGNSGGPLFNMNGEVIGITSAKYSGYSSSGATIEGIGFAIPINDVMNMLEDLKEYGYLRGQASLGVIVQNANSGVRVSSVVEGSCAETAGIEAGDIITKLGEDFVGNYTQLAQVLRKYEAGDSTTVTVLRNGHTVELTITFDEKQNTTVSNPQEEIPDEGSSYEEWYDYFEKYFGGR